MTNIGSTADPNIQCTLSGLKKCTQEPTNTRRTPRSQPPQPLGGSCSSLYDSGIESMSVCSLSTHIFHSPGMSSTHFRMENNEVGVEIQLAAVFTPDYSLPLWCFSFGAKACFSPVRGMSVGCVSASPVVHINHQVHLQDCSHSPFFSLNKMVNSQKFPAITTVPLQLSPQPETLTAAIFISSATPTHHVYMTLVTHSTDKPFSVVVNGLLYLFSCWGVWQKSYHLSLGLGIVWILTTLILVPILLINKLKK